MGLYYVEGRIGTFDAAATWVPPGTIAALYNLSATRRIKVTRVAFGVNDTGTTTMRYILRRIATTGTATSTVTPDDDNAMDDDVTPPSTASLRLGKFTSEPVLLSRLYPLLVGVSAATATQHFSDLPFKDGIVLNPDSGLAIYCEAGERMNNLFASFTFED